MLDENRDDREAKLTELARKIAENGECLTDFETVDGENGNSAKRSICNDKR